MKFYNAFIAIGSNMGDKALNCRAAIDALESNGLGQVKRVSRFYRTEPVDYTDQDWFVNCVVKIATALAPLDLLKALAAIETAAGRDRNGIRFCPRIIDLDILLYDDRVMDTPALTIPHPRMHKRRFVLKPFCDIDPDILHPVIRQRMKALLTQLDTDGQEVVAVC